MLGMQGNARDVKAEAEALTKLAESEGRSMPETGAAAMASVLSFVLPAPVNLPTGLPKVHPAEVSSTDKELLASLQKQLKSNCDLLEKLLKKRSDQVMAIGKVEKLALSASPFVNRTGGVRFLGAAGQTLKLLYDADIITEEAVIAWGQQKVAAAALDPEMDMRFYEKAKPFITWLEEASSSEEESESDEE